MKRKFIYLLLIMFSITSVKAYATNATGTSYDEEKSLTTGENIPTVTITITDITSTSATVKATITGDDPYEIYDINVCLSTDGNNFECSTCGYGYGVHVVEITDLDPGTTYYVKAFTYYYYYDENNNYHDGYIYSEVKDFSTNSTIQPPTVITSTKIFEHGTNSVISGGEVTNTGGAAINERGIQWSIDENFNNYTTQNHGSIGTGSFTSTITGLEPGKTYYVRAYATNSQECTGYGNVITFTKKNVFTQNYTSAGEVATNNEDKAYSLIFSYPNTNGSQDFDCTLLGFHSVTNLTNPETTLDHLIIPNTVTYNSQTEYKVTAIDDEAFYSAVAINSDMSSLSSYLRDIRNVTIPENVTSIGKNAFNGVGSNNIYSPGRITIEGQGVEIGEQAFYGTTFTKMYLSATPPNLGTGDYNSRRNRLPRPTNTTVQVIVPIGAKSVYFNYDSSLWNDNTNDDIDIIEEIFNNPYIISSNGQTYSLILNYADDNNKNHLKVKLGDAPNGSCSLIIPATVNIDGVEYNITQIEEEAFKTEACANFKSVICHRITAPDIDNSSFSGFTPSVPLYVGGNHNDNGIQSIDESYDEWENIEINSTKLFSSIYPASIEKTYNNCKSVYTITDVDSDNTDINYNQCAISFIEITGNNPSLDIEESVEITNTDNSYPITCNVTAIKDGVFNGKTFNSITVYAENVALGDNAVTIASEGFIYIPEMYRNKYETSWPGTKKYMRCFVNETNNEVDYYTTENGYWRINQEADCDSKIVIKGKCKITGNNTVSIDSYYLLKGASLNLYIDQGAQLVHNTGYGPLTVTKTINKFTNQNASDGWYTISSPLEGNIDFTVANSPIGNLIPTNEEIYDLYRYNESATNNKHWHNYKQDNNAPGFTTLDSGRGYLYARGENTNIIFNGNVNTSNVNVGTLTCSDVELSGIHLLGNPFTHNIYKGKSSYAINNSKLANGYYVLENSGTWTPKTNNEAIKPGQGFLVKTSNVIEELYIRKRTTGPSKSSEAMLKISLSNDNHNDVAYVSFNEGIGLDKISHINENAPMLYIPVNGIDYAIAIQDKDVKEIPVCAKIKTMGEYTIDVKTMACEFDNIILVDRLTGIKTNMLTDSYTFMATSNDNPNRFIIRLTDENIATEDENFIFINNNELIINNISGNAIIDIYDVMGRRVYNTTGRDDVHIVSTDGYSAGVYVIRLMDENGLRTQKVIID